VRSAAACVVLIGAIGLATDPGAELTVQDLRRLLNCSAVMPAGNAPAPDSPTAVIVESSSGT
jgi:hypothetical protein